MKGSFHQSRRQSDYYNRLKEGERKDYAISWVATLNHQLLKPFIEITHETKHGREISYKININRLLKVEEENKQLREEIERLKIEMNETKCIQCGSEISESDRFNHEFMYDDDGNLWCMSCAEVESDTGEIY